VKILRREQSWIHTHFITDCVYLPADRAKEIRRAMAPVLEADHIVFGLHFEAPRDEPGLSIVLECRPLPEALARIEAELARIVAAIPARPRQTKVKIEPPKGIARERS